MLDAALDPDERMPVGRCPSSVWGHLGLRRWPVSVGQACSPGVKFFPFVIVVGTPPSEERCPPVSPRCPKIGP
ncbi:hypothetical protein AHF37_00139 [Paragonimus kellicotti]|nr:hypothetical protein AHF37_00139 [Paragonimus kellicotti]